VGAGFRVGLRCRKFRATFADDQRQKRQFAIFVMKHEVQAFGEERPKRPSMSKLMLLKVSTLDVLTPSGRRTPYNSISVRPIVT
jgi:hypothetical protein